VRTLDLPSIEQACYLPRTAPIRVLAWVPLSIPERSISSMPMLTIIVAIVLKGGGS
jgi:hypothetical protein